MYNDIVLLCCKYYDLLQCHYYWWTLCIKLLQNINNNNQDNDNINDDDNNNDNNKDHLRLTILVQISSKVKSMINNDNVLQLQDSTAYNYFATAPHSNKQYYLLLLAL